MRIPKTTLGDVLSSALQAIEAAPPVDFKSKAKAKGAQQASQEAVKRVLS